MSVVLDVSVLCIVPDRIVMLVSRIVLAVLGCTRILPPFLRG